MLRDPRVGALTITELNPDHGSEDGSTLAGFSERLVAALAGAGASASVLRRVERDRPSPGAARGGRRGSREAESGGSCPSHTKRSPGWARASTSAEMPPPVSRQARTISRRGHGSTA